MTTMVEQVARALCRFEGNPENTLFEGKPMWASYVEEARAAIGAMREPTASMFQAGLRAPDPNKVGAIPPLNIWLAMIDAALDER